MIEVIDQNSDMPTEQLPVDNSAVIFQYNK